MNRESHSPGTSTSRPPGPAAGPLSLPLIAVSVFLAVGVAIGGADLLVPLFWQRPLLVRLALLLPVTILSAVALLPVTRRYALAAVASRQSERPWWVIAAVALATSAGLVVSSAAARQAAILNSAPAASTYPRVDYVLEFIFLFLLGTGSAMAYADLVARKLDAEERLFFALAFVGLCFIGIHIANGVLADIDTSTNLWRLRQTLFHGYTTTIPIGDDFRNGLYLPAQALVSGLGPYGVPNFYPPLVAVLSLPYLLFDQDHAYYVHVLVLILANLISLGLATVLARRAYLRSTASDKGKAYAISLLLFLFLAYDVLSAYPFVFSFDRGNIDIIAMMFGLAAILLALDSPRQVWLPVILLSIAVQIKIYPALLFAGLYLWQGRKIILPAILVNCALLLVAGPANALAFVHSLSAYYQPVVAPYNHSGYAFATLLASDFPATAAALPIGRVLFTMLPLAIWLAAWPALLRLVDRRQAVVSAYMITAPPMILVSAIGNDYQLVVLWSVILLALSRILFRMIERSSVADYVQLLLLSTLLLLLGRSDVLMGSPLAIVQDKYLWVLVLEIFMLADIQLQSAEARAMTTA